MGQELTIVVNMATVLQAVSPGSDKRGTEYARQGAVRQTTWDHAEGILRGTVRGRRDEARQAEAFLSVADGRPARLTDSTCSCPSEGFCRHVVALIRSVQPAESLESTSARPAQPAACGRSLDPQLGLAAGGTTPLAIQLTVTSDSGEPWWLAARPVRPGLHSAWVDGDLKWATLDTAGYLRGYSERQIQLLRSLYRLYQRCSGGRGPRGYKRSIDLSAISARQLWQLLDEARAVGVRLVYPGAGGELPAYQDATFHLDVARKPAGLRITPVLRAGDQELGAPKVFIGPGGDGAVCIDRAQAETGEPESWRFRLVRLAEPVPPKWRPMALAEPRHVPADEEPGFYLRGYPVLRRELDLISSDGSFDPPVISGPELVLRARYGQDHEVSVRWEWAYQIGDSEQTAPLGVGDPDDPDDEYRDFTAELALLDRLDLPTACYRLGLARRWSRSAAMLIPHTCLTGLDTMRFSTELLPRLERQPGVTVRVNGAPADYRQAQNPADIRVSTKAAGDTDWFDLRVTITVDGHQVERRRVLMALSQGWEYLLLPDGTYFSLDQPELHKLARLIEEASALHDSGPLRLSRFHTDIWNELAALGPPGDQAAAWREQVQGLLSSGGVCPVEPPEEWRDQLRPYQRDGFSWLVFLWQHRLGGILADEMGLGKTLQCLALISHARQHDRGAAPFLIVAPTSVVPNWAAEAVRFAPELTVQAYDRSMARRGRSLGELAAGADAVVTSYDRLRHHFAAYAGLDWSGLLLDEAQRVKDRRTKVYHCARKLAAPVKIAITGTPLENTVMDLWSLLSITAPGLFPSSEGFRNYYARPIERGDPERLDQLQRRIRLVVKRRTKAQVAADLPSKKEHVMEIDLDPRHRRIYQRWLVRTQQKVMGLVDDIKTNRFAILSSLTLMRRLTLHAGLVDKAYAGLPSAKIEALLGQLGELTGGGHRALVFSQYTQFLGMVRERLEAEGMPYCYLDGHTRDRAGVVQKFQAGVAPVFLMSLKAGGYGLNLTAADHCILLDPWWNPATEAQAIGRVHRIGQTRDVTVCRMVARDTIEKKVLDLQAGKAQLFDSVIGNDQMFAGALTADDIRNLLS